MADNDTLEKDLSTLRKAFLAADQRCAALSATHPRAVDVVAGEAVITPEQHAELDAVRAERLEIVMQLWETRRELHAAASA